MILGLKAENGSGSEGGSNLGVKVELISEEELTDVILGVKDVNLEGKLGAFSEVISEARLRTVSVAKAEVILGSEVVSDSGSKVGSEV